MRLLLIRHGETEWSPSARLQGSTDVSLSAIGRAQAAALARALAREPIDELISSPLARAHETAKIIAEARGLAVRSDPRIRELHLGAWEGRTLDEVQRRWSDELAAWRRNLEVVPPGGEPRMAARERLASFAGEVQRSTAGTVAVVGHLLAFQTLISQLMGISPPGRWPFHLYTASLSEMRLEGQEGSILYLNRVSHLAAAGLDVESIKDR